MAIPKLCAGWRNWTITVAMTQEIQDAIRAFNEIILGGVPFLLRQNDTAFLSFMCSVAAVDALSGYRHTTNDVGPRFRDFIDEYFPTSYKPHINNLYLFRCRVLHNFSPAYFSVTHGDPSLHLQPSTIGDTYLNDIMFFNDVKSAAEKFFTEVQTNVARQTDMSARLSNSNRGGAIYYP